MMETTETMPGAATTLRKNEVLPNMANIGRSSWSAIFSGTVVALISNIVLGLLGVGIGLSTISAAPGAAGGVGIGAIVWSAIVAFAAMYAGGWVTARFAGMQRSFDAVLHGLVTWGLTSMLIMFLLATTIGAVLSGGMGLLRGMTGAYSMLPPETQQQVQAAVPGAGGQMGQQQQPARPALPGQTEAQAQQLGQQAAAVTSGAAWGGFFMLAIGGIAAALGGAKGRIRGTIKV